MEELRRNQKEKAEAKRRAKLAEQKRARENAARLKKEREARSLAE